MGGEERRDLTGCVCHVQRDQLQRLALTPDRNAGRTAVGTAMRSPCCERRSSPSGPHSSRPHRPTSRSSRGSSRRTPGTTPPATSAAPPRHTPTVVRRPGLRRPTAGNAPARAPTMHFPFHESDAMPTGTASGGVPERPPEAWSAGVRGCGGAGAGRELHRPAGFQVCERRRRRVCRGVPWARRWWPGARPCSSSPVRGEATQEPTRPRRSSTPYRRPTASSAWVRRISELSRVLSPVRVPCQCPAMVT